MSIDRHKLRGAYARLKGMQQAVMGSHACRGTLGRDFNSIARQVGQIIGEPTTEFELPRGSFYNNGDFCSEDEVQNKLNQLVSYLEYTQHVGAEVIQIGSIFNSIQDEQLKSRCADLLSAPSNFDRVINQATQVLEDRIRTKASGEGEGLVGAALVNKVVKSEPSLSVLKLSDEKSEQEGYANILRGMVGAYRNPSHHHVLDDITREDALKVCAFINSLLKVVDGAAVNKTP